MMLRVRESSGFGWENEEEEEAQLPDEEEVLRKSGGLFSLSFLLWCRNFYSECCRLFVPGNLTALMAYHVVVPFHHVCRPCGEVCVYR
ncbi:hypothetical protein BHM03_00004269 [Ensete ventricosum]|uniref:Uncharacterized protein n=1 Tax=Ensete ventricosum TaxID=4639 RepID=A0A445MAQ1_ENSVE|nr:hypothetical protein BHM03_00004269 [Ensete ventricosum]